MRCCMCEEEIEFDHNGSIELQFHHPCMKVESYVFCQMRCLRGWIE